MLNINTALSCRSILTANTQRAEQGGKHAHVSLSRATARLPQQSLEHNRREPLQQEADDKKKEEACCSSGVSVCTFVPVSKYFCSSKASEHL